MPPTLLLIRHAQALHNVSSDWSLPDPKLTPLGEEQCRELHVSLQSHPLANKVELIVVSPMRRTLQTTTIGLDFLIKKGIPVLADPNWQENADKPCDTGSEISVMEREFAGWGVDFGGVDEKWVDKTSDLPNNPYAFSRKAILARGQTCLKDLYKRPEKVVAVVSHSGFLRTAICNRNFFNADWRVFEFDEEEGGKGQMVLREWEETEGKGGGMGRSERGVWGIVEGDFPVEREVDGMDGEGKKEGLGEASREVPGK